VGGRYEAAIPQVSLGCEKLNEMLVMAESMITGIREII